MPAPDRPGESRSRAFVLTLWSDRAGAPWRAALRPVDGGERRGFADLGQLAAFLLRLDEEHAPPGEERPAGPRAGDTASPASGTHQPWLGAGSQSETDDTDDDQHGV